MAFLFRYVSSLEFSFLKLKFDSYHAVLLKSTILVAQKSSEQKYNRLGHLEINETQNPFFAAMLNLTLAHDDCFRAVTVCNNKKSIVTFCKPQTGKNVKNDDLNFSISFFFNDTRLLQSLGDLK